MLTQRSLPLLFSIAIVPVLQAQAGAVNAAGKPEFEVASIRPASPANPAIDLRNLPGGKIIITQYTLGLLIQFAFNVQHYQVVGGPGWIETERFDITAIPPASSAASQANPPSPHSPLSDEQRAMLQSLLVERFGLKYRVEDRDGPVYLLTRGTKPLALTPPAHPTSVPYLLSIIRQGGIVNGEMEGENLSMPFFATKLARYLERPVLDQTGLPGSYDIHLPAADQENTDLVGGIINSVERLGLKLKGGRGPVHTVIIDAATHPTEN
jgi:uncharacterized protein (TIGR03435 family)